MTRESFQVWPNLSTIKMQQSGWCSCSPYVFPRKIKALNIWMISKLYCLLRPFIPILTRRHRGHGRQYVIHSLNASSSTSSFVAFLIPRSCWSSNGLTEFPVSHAGVRRISPRIFLLWFLWIFLSSKLFRKNERFQCKKMDYSLTSRPECVSRHRPPL